MVIRYMETQFAATFLSKTFGFLDFDKSFYKRGGKEKNKYSRNDYLVT